MKNVKIRTFTMVFQKIMGCLILVFMVVLLFAHLINKITNSHASVTNIGGIKVIIMNVELLETRTAAAHKEGIFSYFMCI